MYLADKSIQVVKGVLIRFPQRIARIFGYISEFVRYRRVKDNRFAVKWSEMYPCLDDRISTTPFDQHYIYHPAWAARILATNKPEYHVDISSILSFSTIVSAFIPVKFYDYRPAEISLSGLGSESADLLALPFADGSIPSLSCMHTVEHIGLGRYGDPIDPGGDIKATRELIRVLKTGGDLLFVTPVGKPKIAFNAHRVYSHLQIMEYFSTLNLMEFSMIPDSGGLIINADPEMVPSQEYACGCYWFRKY
jgi:hypothetical protein